MPKKININRILIASDHAGFNLKEKIKKFLLKKGKKVLFKNPMAFRKKNRNIQLHFDMFHGFGNLEKAINELDEKEKEDFRSFSKNRKSFNRENLFFCRYIN